MNCVFLNVVVAEERTTRTLFVSPSIIRLQDVSGLCSYVTLVHCVRGYLTDRQTYIGRIPRSTASTQRGPNYKTQTFVYRVLGCRASGESIRDPLYDDLNVGAFHNQDITLLRSP